MTVSDILVRHIALFATVILAYGQAVAITAIWLQISMNPTNQMSANALANQEEYGATSWYSICGALNWILTFGGLCLRHKEHFMEPLGTIKPPVTETTFSALC